MRTGKITRQWFRSILVVVATVLLAALLLCVYMLYSLRANVMRMSGDMAGYMRQNIDSRLDDIQKNTVLLELHSATGRLKKMNHIPFVITPDIYQYCDQMYNFRSSNTLVENIYIYYPKMDAIAAGGGLYSADAYLSLLDLYPDNAYSEWRPGDGLRGDSQFVLIEKGEKAHLLFVRDMRYERETVGTIVVEINLEELLQGEYGGQKGQISAFGLVVNGRHILAAGSDQSADMHTVIPADGAQRQGITEGNGVTAYTLPSFFPGLWYVAGYSQRSMFAPLYTAGVICAAGMLLSVSAAVVLSLRISRRNTRPLTDILEKFSGPDTGELDEFEYINAKIDQLLADQYKRGEKLQQQQNLLHSMFLSSAIQGELWEEYVAFSSAKRCDVEFENPVYQVAVLRAPSPPSEPQLEALLARCETLGYDALATRRDGKCVLLLNPETPLPGRAANRIAKELLALFDAPTVCGFGRGYDSLVDIHTSYAEALEALPELSAAHNAIGFFSRAPRRDEILPQRGQEMMEEFVRQMYAGRYNSALAALDGIFGAYLDPAARPGDTDRRLVTLQTLLMDALEKKRAIETAPPAALLYKLQTAGSAAELQTVAHSVLGLLARTGQVQEEREQDTVPHRAKLFIRQNLTSPMLGLYMISEKLGVSNTYLSSSFKSAFGIGVVQYINTLRIEKAKELILQTDMSIKDIALQVGFSSDTSFIRVFKKYEEKTPTALRKTTAPQLK